MKENRREIHRLYFSSLIETTSKVFAVAIQQKNLLIVPTKAMYTGSTIVKWLSFVINHKSRKKQGKNDVQRMLFLAFFSKEFRRIVKKRNIQFIDLRTPFFLSWVWFIAYLFLHEKTLPQEVINKAKNCNGLCKPLKCYPSEEIVMNCVKESKVFFLYRKFHMPPSRREER